MPLDQVQLSPDRGTQLRTVLCIDDQANILALLHRFLQAEGFKVTTAAGGRQGLDLMSNSPPDAVVLDCQMPEIDGLTVALEICRRYPHIPIVIYAATPPRIPERLVELADAVIEKGQSLTQLSSALNTLSPIKTGTKRLRQHPRRRVRLNTRFTLHRSAGALTDWVEIKNISESGIGGELAIKLEVANVVRLDLLLPEISMLFGIDAQVRHHSAHFHGFEFLGVRPSDRELIRQFCEKIPASPAL